MRNDYEDLRLMIERLQDEEGLLVPKVGFEDEVKLVWMSESSSKTLITTVTKKGFVTITANGETLVHDDIFDVQAMYLVVFKSGNSLEDSMKALAEEE